MASKQRPKPYPSKGLEQIKTQLRDHPDVAKVGLTITDNGDWALMVWPRTGAEIPIPDVENICSDYPVVYNEAPTRIPVARPAYPRKGE